MAVVTVGGTVLFRGQLPDKRWFGAPVRSSGGERFAVIETRLRGIKSEALDMYPFSADDRVVVFSIADRKAILAVKVEGDSPWVLFSKAHRNQTALSPEGQLLAIVSNETLRIYRLPESQ